MILKADEEQIVTYSKSECIPPTPQNSQTATEVEAMFNSHLWKLEKAQAQSNGNGILIRMNCARCGADKVAILKEDEHESA